ncbi:unnamed protein product [Enterobius vermicularis]|uniref:SLEI domain protein, PF07620 family n=1 Tax=Enterobius vermicularis TaxID=51028 RepID=A0A0N4UZ92_ENTVE|nr:unnamed protein product [Enterobius vermicularis]
MATLLILFPKVFKRSKLSFLSDFYANKKTKFSTFILKEYLFMPQD